MKGGRGQEKKGRKRRVCSVRSEATRKEVASEAREREMLGMALAVALLQPSVFRSSSYLTFFLVFFGPVEEDSLRELDNADDEDFFPPAVFLRGCDG